MWLHLCSHSPLKEKLHHCYHHPPPLRFYLSCLNTNGDFSGSSDRMTFRNKRAFDDGQLVSQIVCNNRLAFWSDFSHGMHIYESFRKMFDKLGQLL